jgi:predicted amidophosphoribosyltransferase
MILIAQQMVALVLELVFGSLCLGCGARGRGVPCNDCARACAVQIADLDGALFVDRAPVRELVRGAKFGRWGGGARWFAEQLDHRLRTDGIDVGAVAWVPGDPSRVRARGIDLPGAVARSYARRLGVPCVQLLTRVRGSRPQRGLHRFERDENARASFDVHPRAAARLARLELAGSRSILLIDDVCTTGATLRVCQALLGVVLRRRFRDIHVRPYAMAVVPPPDRAATGVRIGGVCAEKPGNPIHVEG